jgi:hypothetical protein
LALTGTFAMIIIPAHINLVHLEVDAKFGWVLRYPYQTRAVKERKWALLHVASVQRICAVARQEREAAG